MVLSHRIFLLTWVSHKALSVAPSCFRCTSMIFLQPQHSLLRRPCSLMTQLSLHLGRLLAAFVPMNAILSSVYQWLIDNKLSLTVAESKCMLIHSKRKSPSSLHITFNGSSIEQVEIFKLLGVIIDHHLHWRPHIDSVVKSVSRSVHLRRRLSWFLSTNALKAFYFA